MLPMLGLVVWLALLVLVKHVSLVHQVLLNLFQVKLPVTHVQLVLSPVLAKQIVLHVQQDKHQIKELRRALMHPKGLVEKLFQ